MDQLSLNGFNRPRSAALSQHMSQTSFGRFFNQNSGLDETTVTQVWRAFGSYVAKELRNGRGVAVPRFGNFTFTSAIVDLAGTTNPGERDKQVREPVFIVGKDFVSAAVHIKSGMAHNKGAQVRPFDNKGVCGIVPKVKINYTEVSTNCALNKDVCKTGCEQIFRFLSDKAKKGESVVMELPFVGTFIVKAGIAAISFNEDLIEETRGSTAKNHYVNKLFSSSVNKHNLQIQDHLMIRHNPTAGLGGAIKLTGDAETWLKSNLNININDIANFSTVEPIAPQSKRRLSSAHPANRQLTSYNTVRQKSWAIKQNPENGLLTEHNKTIFDQYSESKNQAKSTTAAGAGVKRPASAITRGSSASRMSNVPELARSRLVLIANDIYRVRQQLTEIAKSDPSGNLREILSSSEIQGLLKKVGLNIEIGFVKALLKHFGFNWNGKSCSLMNLFQKCQDLIEGKDQIQQQSVYNTLLEKIGKKKPTVDDFVRKIKDLFYASKKTMFELFTEGKTGSGIDAQGLKKLVQKLSSNIVTDEQIEQAFNHSSKGVESLTYQEFEKYFSWPKQAGTDWETKCFRMIRDWMQKNALSSETAFELFLGKANKVIQRKLTRVDFHLALSELDLKFSAPEVDSLFKLLDFNNDGELDLEEWAARVYCDSANPLQMIREIIQENKLTPDDLLFRMSLRVWDNPIDFPKFSECIRKLDPSLGDAQLRVMAKLLKNKDNKIEIPTLVSNLSGKEFETIDYRNKIFKKIYQQIYPSNETQFLKLMEDADPQNDGRVEPAALRLALAKLTQGIDQETIDRFVRFLDKDTSGKINYIGFMDSMNGVSNRDHNPFKSVVQRLDFFIVSNKQTVESLVTRLIQKSGSSSPIGIPVAYFAEFLKAKIDKKRNYQELDKYARYMDIDKDGLVSEIDIQTCIDNLQSDAFFKNCGEALASSTFSSQQKFYPINDSMTPDRALEIAKQIKSGMINSKIAYREAFNRFDQNQDGFLSFSEFSSGLDKIISLSLPVKEKFFSFMDKKKIGLVDYDTFLSVIQASQAKDIARNNFTDSFDWENSVIEQIKNWIIREKITIEEGFKCFDRDFDGFILKDDLKWGLQSILRIKEEEIQQTRLDRLFKLMDFFKTNKIQLSDFQRLLNDQNPYATSSGKFTASSERFKSSLGGGFGLTSTFDWKLSAIQSIGLTISKKYTSVRESFDDASDSSQKVTFDQFKRFVEKHQALNGFNMTLPLLQKLFAEIDPHKKGYLTESDWSNSLAPFKLNDQTFIELKNLVQCSFTDSESAFQFFLSFKSSSESKKKTISKSDFEKAVSSLSGGRFGPNEISGQWKYFSQGGKYVTIDKYIFRSHFDSISYQGLSTVKATPGARTTIVSVNSSNAQWEADIIEKLRQIVRSSSLSFEDIFKKFDEDGNGFISSIEFRNAIRKLNLGLSSREIDLIMKRVDTNGDGNIDWKEFVSKFKTSDLDDRLKERAKDRMGRLKELMIMHMISPVDAFRFFDESKLGKLTYQEFSRLVVKAHEVAGDRIPSYPVIKDLFDTIDIRKDGIIDLSEWQQTFGLVTEGNSKLSIKATPTSTFDNTRDYARIGSLIAKNRKLLRENFEKIIGAGGDSTTVVSYDQAKQVLEALLQPHFNNLNDEKLRVVLKVGEVLGANESGLGNRVDYVRMLNVYKDRHAAPQL